MTRPLKPRAAQIYPEDIDWMIAQNNHGYIWARPFAHWGFTIDRDTEHRLRKLFETEAEVFCTFIEMRDKEALLAHRQERAMPMVRTRTTSTLLPRMPLPLHLKRRVSE